jgi:hypothetical protein
MLFAQKGSILKMMTARWKFYLLNHTRINDSSRSTSTGLVM